MFLSEVEGGDDWVACYFFLSVDEVRTKAKFGRQPARSSGQVVGENGRELI